MHAAAAATPPAVRPQPAAWLAASAACQHQQVSGRALLQRVCSSAMDATASRVIPAVIQQQQRPQAAAFKLPGLAGASPLQQRAPGMHRRPFCSRATAAGSAGGAVGELEGGSSSSSPFSHLPSWQTKRVADMTTVERLQVRERGSCSCCRCSPAWQLLLGCVMRASSAAVACSCGSAAAAPAASPTHTCSCCVSGCLRSGRWTLGTSARAPVASCAPSAAAAQRRRAALP
jgi:hypothetical protein